MKKYRHYLQTLPVLAFAFLAMVANAQIMPGPGKASASTGTAQPRLVKTQGSSESDNIRCSLQDKAGNLWFGTTAEGVYLYDGHSFTQFTVKDGLSSNAVYSLLEDSAGNIWIGTVDGLCRLNAHLPNNGQGKKITAVTIPYNFFDANSSDTYYTDQSKKTTVWSMLQDKHGKIWLGTGLGVYCYDGRSFTHFLQSDGVINKEKLHLKMVDCIIEDNNGNIWFASGCPPGMEGVCRYDGSSISSFKPNGDGWVRIIKADTKGQLWFGGRSHGNFVYDGTTFSNFTQKTGIGNPLLVDKNGSIWFGGVEKQNTVQSLEGIWNYDGKTFTNFGPANGMSPYAVWNMLQDNKGNIWLGTRNTGLYKFDGTVFTKFSE